MYFIGNRIHAILVSQTPILSACLLKHQSLLLMKLHSLLISTERLFIYSISCHAIT